MVRLVKNFIFLFLLISLLGHCILESQVINIDYVSKFQAIDDELKKQEGDLITKNFSIENANAELEKLKNESKEPVDVLAIKIKQKQRDIDVIKSKVSNLQEKIKSLEKIRLQFLAASEDKSNIQFLERTSFSIVKNVSNFLPNLQLLKITIGEPAPGKIKIPLYLFVGSPFNLKDDINHERTVAELLNPIGGLLNFYLQGESGNMLARFDEQLTLTKLKAKGSLIAKYISGTDTVNKTSNEFFNFAANGDLFFQTGAWESDLGYDPERTGVFWININLNGNISTGDKLKSIFTELTKNYFWSLSFGFKVGLYIEDKVNINVGYIYNMSNDPISNTFKNGVFKISTDLNVLK